VKVRGAHTVVIAEEDQRLRTNADELLVLPESDANISPLLGVIPLQLLAYYMSGCGRPDFPGIDRTLTVD
jgi:glucosamine--fructose-6-phosphate aminotransferase (isomerizing)